MISIYHRVNDHYEVSNDAAILPSLNREDIIWVDLLGWDQNEEQIIEKYFDLEIMNATEAVEIEHSSRFFEYENYLVSYSRFITQKGTTTVPEIVTFTVEKKLLITNRDYDFKSFKETAKKVLNSNSKFGSSEVFLSLIDLRIEKNADLVEEFTIGVSELSKTIITDKRTSKPLILNLNSLRENLMLMMQNCIEIKLLISVIKKTTFLNPKTENELDISVKDLESVIDFIRFNFDRMDYIDSTLNNLITYEQNNSLKLFTIVSLFFMPPMLIASIYGMNFHIMPELYWKFGYPFAILLMLLTVIATFFYFKQKKWL